MSNASTYVFLATITKILTIMIFKPRKFYQPLSFKLLFVNFLILSCVFMRCFCFFFAFLNKVMLYIILNKNCNNKLINNKCHRVSTSLCVFTYPGLLRQPCHEHRVLGVGFGLSKTKYLPKDFLQMHFVISCRWILNQYGSLLGT